jgi:hypothetical protein
MGRNHRIVHALRFSVVLPMLLCLLTFVLWVWGLQVPVPRDWDTGFTPSPILIGYAISAPALIFKLLSLPFRWANYWPIEIGRVALDDLFFFLGVFVLWHLVGRALDQQISKKPRVSMGVGNVLWELALVAFGVILFSAGIKRIPLTWPRTNQILFLAWGLVLVIFPGLKLLNAIRRKSSRPAVAA